MRTARLLLLAGLLLAPVSAAQGVDDAPTGVHTAYGDPPTTNLTISWVGPASTTAEVRYGPADGDRDQVAQATSEPIPYHDRRAYQASLTDLEPNTTYGYEIQLDQGSWGPAEVATAPEPGANGTHTFTVYADHGTAGAGTENVEDKPARVDELVDQLDPDVHLVPGDLAYADGSPETWDDHQAQIQPVASRVPYMVVPGNHEREDAPDEASADDAPVGEPEPAQQGFAQYDARFAMPSGPEGRWHAFQHGNVLVVALNSETACDGPNERDSMAPGPGRGCEPIGSEDRDEFTLREDQTRFLADQLSRAENDTAIDWTIVLSHHPLVSSGPHGDTEILREGWGPILDRYGAALVLAGHDHVYERTHPLQEDEVATNGTVHLTAGAAGSHLYSFPDEEPPNATAVRQNTTHGVLELAVDGDVLEGRFVTLNGSTFDRFTLANVDEGVRAAPSTNTTAETTSSTPLAGPSLLAAMLAAATALARRRDPRQR